MKIFFRNIREELNYIFKKLGLMILFFIGLPALSVWFCGAYYNNYVDNVPIAILDEDNSALSREIAQYFNDNERFDVTYYASSKSELQDLISTRKVYMGVCIPKHLSDDVKSGKQTQVLILTDGTNVIVGNNLYAGAAQIIQSVSVGASVQVLQGKVGLEEQLANNTALSFGFQERMLYDPKLTYMNYLMYGLCAVIFQQLFLSALATLLSRNATEVANKDTVVQILGKVVVSAALLTGAGAFAIYLMHKKFGLIFNGNVPVALLITVLFALAVSCPGLIIYGFTKKKTRFTQIVYMLSLPTFLTCGYVWPMEQMPRLLVAIIKALWPLINYARAFDELMIKHLSFRDVSGNIIGLLIYIIVAMPLAIWCFKVKLQENTPADKDSDLKERFPKIKEKKKRVKNYQGEIPGNQQL